MKTAFLVLLNCPAIPFVTLSEGDRALCKSPASTVIPLGAPLPIPDLPVLTRRSPIQLGYHRFELPLADSTCLSQIQLGYRLCHLPITDL